jgi:hypothetical protein
MDENKQLTKLMNEFDTKVHTTASQFTMEIKTFQLLKQMFKRINDKEVNKHPCNVIVSIDDILKNDIELPNWREWNLFNGPGDPLDTFVHIHLKVIPGYRLSSIDVYAILRRVLLSEFDINYVKTLIIEYMHPDAAAVLSNTHSIRKCIFTNENGPMHNYIEVYQLLQDITGSDVNENAQEIVRFIKQNTFCNTRNI